MEYIHFGKEGGETYVILPGLSLKSVIGSADAIIAAYKALAEDYDIYLLDHIDKEPAGYSIEDMAADTLKAFDELGIKKAHIMGVSMGGMVAQAIALKETARISSLILCSTSSKGSDLNKDAYASWKEYAGKKDALALSKAFGHYVYTPSFYEQYKALIDRMGEGASDQDYSNFLISLEAVRSFDVSGRIKEIKCPVFVLGAGEDRVLGKGSEELIKVIGCDGYSYEGRGHGVYDEAPGFLEKIKEFLALRILERR